MGGKQAIVEATPLVPLIRAPALRCGDLFEPTGWGLAPLHAMKKFSFRHMQPTQLQVAFEA